MDTMTPFKTGRSSHDNSSCRLSIDSPLASSCGNHNNLSDMAMEDESSVLSSPPRSATRTTGMSLFFDQAAAEDDDDDDDNDHSSIGLDSVLRRRRRSNSGTPRNRRLFDEGDAGLAKTVRKRSPLPAFSLRTNQKDSAETTTTRVFGASLSMDETEMGVNRKRSSAERRGESATLSSPRISPNSFLTMDGRFVHSKNPFSSPMMTEESSSSENSHYHHSQATVAAAPPLPDSFLKSTELELGFHASDGNVSHHYSSTTPPQNNNHNNNHNATETGTKNTPPPPPATSFFAPRRPKSPPQDTANALGAAVMTPFAPAHSVSHHNPNNNNSHVYHQRGYPDHRFSFTGSPIREHHASQPTLAAHPYGHNYNHNHHLDSGEKSHSSPGSNSCVDAMETDTASCGSLLKVRRIRLNDDICSASGHELRSRAHPLKVDTYYPSGGGGSVSSMSSHGSNTYPSYATGHHSHSNNNNNNMVEDISPTDVAQFPPPTPTKSKPPVSGYSYATLRKPRPAVPPPTPVAERRRAAALAARTPHPGSLLHHPSRLSPTREAPTSRFHGDFDVISELGNGCFGTVFKVLSRLDGCMYAIKAAKRQAKGPADRDRMLKEVYALAALSDQADTATFHIVRYHQAWMEEDRLYIQTELCQGNLTGEMGKGNVPTPRRYKLLREICLALEFIHGHNMCHLDIKPENIFVKNDQFKLGDFGLVSKISTQQDIEEGDSRYMSLELLGGDLEDLTKSDIFSLGATVYEICLGRPLPMNGQEWQDIRAGRMAAALYQQVHSDPDMVLLLEQMMQPDFRQRPAASALLKRRQLLSDEQKALMVERTRVAEANLALQKIQLKSPPPMRKGLQRANTWNGQSMNPYC